MSSLIPLHCLVNRGRPSEAVVGHDGRRWVHWHEFAALVAGYAAAYAQRTEQRWLLVAERPLDFAARLLALFHAGKHAVIPPNTLPGTLEQLRHAYDAVADNPPAALALALAPVDPLSATVDLYTSGSTGAPKPIRKTLRQFEAELDALEALWGERLGNCGVFGTAPHHHLYGLTFRVLWPLSAGRPTDDVTCAHPDMLAQRLRIFGDGLLVSSPAQLTRWPDLVSLADLTPKPRMVLSSGGPLPASAATALCANLGEAPTEIYGSSETGVIAWRRQDRDGLWTPLPAVAAAVDERGALRIRSPFVDGDGSWCMEDAVELQPDGRFHLKGRLDRTVKIEEKRLYLPDMESHLASHPWVDNATVVPLQRARQTLGVVAALTPAGRAQLTAGGRRALADALRQHLLHCFDRVLLPRHWRFPTQLPFNERGKLTHAALMELFDNEA